MSVERKELRKKFQVPDVFIGILVVIGDPICV